MLGVKSCLLLHADCSFTLRFISLKHGLPHAVTIESMPVGPPAAVEDHQITEGGIQDSPSNGQALSSIYFFNAMVQLSHIAETIIESISKNTPWLLPVRYANAGDTGELSAIHFTIQLGTVMEQEGKLRSWYDGLPDHLQIRIPNANEKVQRQQDMLQVRYLHTRLMTHRQNLLSVMLCERKNINPLEDNFLRTVVMASVRLCVECACEIVKKVKNSAKSKRIGPWWYNVQCELPCPKISLCGAVLTEMRMPRVLSRSNKYSYLHCFGNLFRSPQAGRFCRMRRRRGCDVFY